MKINASDSHGISSNLVFLKESKNNIPKRGRPISDVKCKYRGRCQQGVTEGAF